MQSGLKLLEKLMEDHMYVFHGSENSNLSLFEPQQAYNYRNGTPEPDGDPAVFASSDPRYAILMALVNKKNCPNGFYSAAGAIRGADGRALLKLKMNKKAFTQLNEKSEGFVYVFDKNKFQQRSDEGFEYRSFLPVAPLKVITVIKEDLPPTIEIIE